MLADSSATLRAVFDDLKADSSRVTLADDAAVAPAVSAHVGGVAWTATSATLLPKIAELLDIHLSRIFVAFWQKADAIGRALEESRKAPDDSMEESLADCSTEAILEPFIEIRFKGALPPKRIPITVSLPLTFRAVKLTIRGGAIVTIAAGECQMEGEVKLGALTLARLTEPVTITLRGWQVPLDHQPAAAVPHAGR
jgi:hypothetical protein